MVELNRLHWHRCTHATCVEVAHDGDVVYIRDSKDRPGGAIPIPVAQWTRFVAAIRNGEFDTPETSLEAQAA